MLEVKTFVTGMIATNTYLIKDVSTKATAVIDPADKSESLIKAIEANPKKPDYILLTHGHFDHIGYALELSIRYGAKILISKEETELLNNSSMNLSASHGINIEEIPVDRALCDGDTINLGDTVISFMHTPGHTSGSGCFIADDVIFSGDTLFCESFGRTDFPTGDFSDIVASVNKLLALQNDYKVYPGHDVSTTLSHERKYNPLALRN